MSGPDQDRPARTSGGPAGRGDAADHETGGAEDL